MLRAYMDAVGVLTIGYGHTGNVQPDDLISPTRAEELLAADLAYFEAGINSSVKVKLSQEQFDALVSFSFNVGLEAFKSSTLLRLLNSGDQTAAANEFLRWTKAAGKNLPGLVRRRQAEQSLFLEGVSVLNA